MQSMAGRPSNNFGAKAAWKQSRKRSKCADGFIVHRRSLIRNQLDIINVNIRAARANQTADPVQKRRLMAILKIMVRGKS